MDYWLLQNNAPTGPYTLADLRYMISHFKISSADLIWAHGMTAWTPVSHVLPVSKEPGSIRGCYKAYKPVHAPDWARPPK